MSGSATLLLYGLIFFKEGYQAANQYDNGMREIRWPLDYFKKCLIDANTFVAQVIPLSPVCSPLSPM